MTRTITTAAVPFSGALSQDLHASYYPSMTRNRSFEVAAADLRFMQVVRGNSIDCRSNSNVKLLGQVRSVLNSSWPFRRDRRYRNISSFALNLVAQLSAAQFVPTPQPHVSTDGTIEISWLVNGQFLTVTVGLDGDGFVLLQDRDKQYIDQDFNIDFNQLSDETIEELRNVLLDMGKAARHRLRQ